MTSIVVYPILVNFGGVTVGTTGSAPVTLANASNAPLTIQQITASPSVYTATNNCGTSLARGLELHGHSELYPDTERIRPRQAFDGREWKSGKNRIER